MNDHVSDQSLGEWRIDWMAGSTWCRLAIATAVLSLGVTLAMLVAASVDRLVVKILEQAGQSGLGEGGIALDLVRTLLMGMAACTVLVVLNQAALWILLRRGHDHRAGEFAHDQMRKKIDRISNALSIMTLVLSFIFLLKINDHMSFFSYYETNDKIILIYIAYFLVWFFVDRNLPGTVFRLIAQRPPAGAGQA